MLKLLCAFGLGVGLMLLLLIVGAVLLMLLVLEVELVERETLEPSAGPCDFVDPLCCECFVLLVEALAGGNSVENVGDVLFVVCVVSGQGQLALDDVVDELGDLVDKHFLVLKFASDFTAACF